jgi:hypothetical protein
MMKHVYVTTIWQEPGTPNTGIQVPAEIVEAFGQGKRPKVKVTINGHTYRSTVAVYGGQFLLPLSKENREAAGVQGGQQVEVTLELDTAPRTVEVPADLAKALKAKPGAMQAFEALSYSARKEHVRQVESAKAAETRQRRIDKIVGQLG